MLAAANGVVIATEKKLPSILVDETSVSIFSVQNYSILALVCKLCGSSLFV